MDPRHGRDEVVVDPALLGPAAPVGEPPVAMGERPDDVAVHPRHDHEGGAEPAGVVLHDRVGHRNTDRRRRRLGLPLGNQVVAGKGPFARWPMRMTSGSWWRSVSVDQVASTRMVSLEYPADGRRRSPRERSGRSRWRVSQRPSPAIDPGVVSAVDGGHPLAGLLSRCRSSPGQEEFLPPGRPGRAFSRTSCSNRPRGSGPAR